MQDDEIAHALELAPHAGVVGIHHILRRALAGQQQFDQPAKTALHKEDAGRFQRFQEARRQAERHHVVHPESLAVAGVKAQQARFGNGRAVQLLQQLLARLLLVDVAASENVAMAGTVAQGDAPCPAGFQRCATGGGREFRPAALGRTGPGPVHREPAAEVDVALSQRTSQQQRGKAGTIDKQIPLHKAAVGQDQMRNTAVRAARRFDDSAFRAAHTAFFGQLAQESCVQHGVKMVGVIELLLFFAAGQHEAALAGHDAWQALCIQGAQPGIAYAAILAPQRARAAEASDIAEGVEIAFTAFTPVAKFNPQLEGSVGGAQKLRFVDAQQFVEMADGGKSSLANADNADFFGFDQLHGGGRERRHECRCGHPAGRSTAHDHDALEC